MRREVGADPLAGEPEQRVRRLSRALVGLFAVSVGVSVANIYYIQPLLPLLRHDFHVSAGVAALATTLSQLGYVLGLLLLLPLGDLVDRRRLVLVLTLACGLALLLAASASSISVLLVALFLVGVTAVVAQVQVPFAASLAPEHERGRVVGLVMSGLLLGILLARTVSGAVASFSSWRVVLYLAAGAMGAVAVLLRARLPRDAPRRGPSYGRLLASLVEIFREEPVLRRRSAYGALGMGCFSALWTSIAFLLAGAPYHYGTDRIGLFGLVGAAGALTATAAGRLADAGRTPQLTVFATACLTISSVPIYFGAHSLAALVVGVILLDVGAQGLQITNQSQIYRLSPERRSRVNAVYMVCFFLGGTAASGLSAALYSVAGWSGVSVLVGVLGAAALVAGVAGLVARERRDAVPS
ncbi:MAG: transporter [Acidimicrobiaceae bacterium]|jgi:predicted MFS family arabinose efflux permease|nr:transporter [Acidimicrobiaceae bacterium]